MDVGFQCDPWGAVAHGRLDRLHVGIRCVERGTKAVPQAVWSVSRPDRRHRRLHPFLVVGFPDGPLEDEIRVSPSWTAGQPDLCLARLVRTVTVLASRSRPAALPRAGRRFGDCLWQDSA